jgi:SAM-dependent methyltransferase
MSSDESLLKYYQEHCFNPVPIFLDTKSAWTAHVAKRRNLYERHLGIPLSLLRGKSVMDIGCNSGENSLVLASVGANLTLVEPNSQVIPRLRALFRNHALEEQIVALWEEDLDTHQCTTRYDLVNAEGFLCTLANRDEMLRKIINLLKPGGLAVISFNDRYGGLLEFTRRLIFWRALALMGTEDVHSYESLALARRFFMEDFSRISASRPFEAWWKDNLVNPALEPSSLWSYQEIVPLLESMGCEFRSSSPQWAWVDHFSWYKNVVDTGEYHAALIDNWLHAFCYFLTGLSVTRSSDSPAPAHVVDAVADLVIGALAYAHRNTLRDLTNMVPGDVCLVVPPEYPADLDEYLGTSSNPVVVSFNTELKHVYEALGGNESEELLHKYHASNLLRTIWGAPYHYVSFSRLA